MGLKTFARVASFPFDAYDEAHKDALESRIQRANNAFGVARKMFEILNESDLNAEGRVTAFQFLNVLQNRLGDK
jgi:hypothetical protein